MFAHALEFMLTLAKMQNDSTLICKSSKSESGAF